MKRVDTVSARAGSRDSEIAINIAPCEAVVTALLGPRAVRVALEDARAGDTRDATLAAAGYTPAVGDRVLVLGAAERAWVIGVVGTLRALPARTHDGVEAQVGEDGRLLTVRDARGAVLFEHDAATGKSVVRSSGDLSVRADGGDLALTASDTVRITARRVAIDAEESVRVATTEGDDALSLGRAGTALTTSALRVVAGVGKLALGEGTFAVTRLETAVKQGRHVLGVAETRAERIVERARNVYREVAELEQTRAGRIRTVARELYSVLADRATIKAEDDLTLMGEKIHLA